MKIIQLIIVAVSLIFLSCNQTPSLDKYYVTHQEKQGFMTIDVPTSILELNTNSLTETQKKAYQSVSKLNFLGFKKSESDAATFTSEKQNVIAILKDSKYQELIRFNVDDKQGMIKYTGTPNNIDEFVFFAVVESEGFIITRILGNDMNPQNIFELLRTLKEDNININADELKKIATFFDTIKK